jgi:hypothetical protein
MKNLIVAVALVVVGLILICGLLGSAMNVGAAPNEATPTHPFFNPTVTPKWCQYPTVTQPAWVTPAPVCTPSPDPTGMVPWFTLTPTPTSRR